MLEADSQIGARTKASPTVKALTAAWEQFRRNLELLSVKHGQSTVNVALDEMPQEAFALDCDSLI